MKKHYYMLHGIAAAAAPLILIFAAKLFMPFFKGTPMFVYSCCYVAIVFYYLAALSLILFREVGVRRLNDYFIELKYPWCKWRFIMQEVNKKHIANMTCRQIAHDFSKQAAVLFLRLRPNRIYIADTHETIIHRLDRNPHIKILEQELSRQVSMKATQKKFLSEKCEKNCSGREQEMCIVRKGLTEKRNMYFIKFEYI